MEVHVSIYKLVINSNLLMSIILISTFKLLLSLNLPAMNIDNFPSCQLLPSLSMLIPKVLVGVSKLLPSQYLFLPISLICKSKLTVIFNGLVVLVLVKFSKLLPISFIISRCLLMVDCSMNISSMSLHHHRACSLHPSGGGSSFLFFFSLCLCRRLLKNIFSTQLLLPFVQCKQDYDVMHPSNEHNCGCLWGTLCNSTNHEETYDGSHKPDPICTFSWPNLLWFEPESKC